MQAADIEEHLKSQALNTFTMVKREKTNKTCFNCGGDYPHVDRPCPARNKTCDNYGKQNHFASQWRSGDRSKFSTKKPVKTRQNLRPLATADDTSSESESDSSEYCYSLDNKQKNPQENILLNGFRMKMTVDTGSSINVIDKNTLRKIRNVKLKSTSVKAYPFNSKTPVRMEGKFRALVKSKDKFTVATIYVTSEDGGCLLSSKSAQELELVSFHLNQMNANKSNPSAPTVNDANLQRILDKPTHPCFVDWENQRIDRLI